MNGTKIVLNVERGEKTHRLVVVRRLHENRSIHSMNTRFVFTCSFVECCSKIEIIGFAADCSLFEFEWSGMSEHRVYVQNHWQLILPCNWINMRRKKKEQKHFVLCSIEMWPSFVHLPIVCVCLSFIVEMLVHCSQLKGFAWFGYKNTQTHHHFQRRKKHIEKCEWVDKEFEWIKRCILTYDRI